MEQVDLSYVILIAILAGLGSAGLLTRDVLRRDQGTEKMREIAAAIRQGARAFLRRQYVSIAAIAAILMVGFAAALGYEKGLEFGLRTAAAFGLAPVSVAEPCALSPNRISSDESLVAIEGLFCPITRCSSVQVLVAVPLLLSPV